MVISIIIKRQLSALNFQFIPGMADGPYFSVTEKFEPKMVPYFTVTKKI
jgi:hypothetical protein